MLTLLAESKTMASSQSPVELSFFNEHSPAFEEMADSLMAFMASLPPADIAERLGISMSLAVKARNLASEFPHKITGLRTLYAFTGDAYRGLDAPSLSQEAIEFAQGSLRIISSVYGILRPSDILKPYRCEFNRPITSDNKTAIQIFKPKVTVNLVNYVKEQKISDIIDLLPADADKCIDWKILRAFSSVHKVVFKTIKSNGELATPLAKRLKELRGIMARDILENKLVSFGQLKSHNSDHYIFSPADSKPGLPVFISD